MISFDDCQFSIFSVHSIKQHLHRNMNVAKREENQYEEILKKVIGILSKMHINRFKGHTSIRVKIIHLDQKGKKLIKMVFVCVVL